MYVYIYIFVNGEKLLCLYTHTHMKHEAKRKTNAEMILILKNIFYHLPLALRVDLYYKM